MSEQPVAQPATAELLALAAATRPDINVRDLEGLLAEVAEAGKPTWPVVMAQTVGMLARGEDLWDLRIALTDPLKQNPESRRRTHF
ncbi:hypothetical protein [Actinomadura litoris]|uniref:hypothetical protein n=1 Tax=Actinomadura litoris TaxID=2678616 RepID=UPI001FA72D29|nr:hypothetical protein [Actinomadura litoris]